MNRRGVSVVRLMAVVLIVGLDCGLVRRLFATGLGFPGVLAVGLGASAGLIGALLTRGAARRFYFGVAAGFPAAVLLLGWAILAFRVPADGLYLAYVDGVMTRAPASLRAAVRGSSRPPGLRVPPVPALVLELLLGAPALLVATVCGAGAVIARRVALPEPPPDLVPNPERP